MTQVLAHSKAAQSGQARVTSERDAKRNHLKQNITKTIDSFGKLNTADIERAQILSHTLNLISKQNLSQFLDDLYDENSSLRLKYTINDSETLNKLLVEIYEKSKTRELTSLLNEFRARAFVADCYEKFDEGVALLCTGLNKEAVNSISNLIADYQALRMPIFGYLFRRSQVVAINTRLQNLAVFTKQIDLRDDQHALQHLLSQGRALIAWMEEAGDLTVNFQSAYSLLVKKISHPKVFHDFVSVLKAFEPINNEVIDKCFIRPETPEIFAQVWINAIKYFQAIQGIKALFIEAPSYDYVGRKSEIEKLNISLMNNEVDGRLVRFMQDSKADAKILAQLIKDKQKFPEDKFHSVKEAFPVIVASIREFGEFMPLKSDIFDVLVIDEASQVSVAQAFPALLRAKKVVIMGDSKQFSNTKSSNASIALNEKYRSDLQSYFKRTVSADAAMLERLSYFDVKRSILEFSQMCSNYSIMLRKHFRSYQELISFSSKTFYGGQLQAIKIRGVPISEVIEFTELSSEVVATRSTNESEAKFILEKCIELLDEENPPSVGIITPFTEQQTYISKLFSSHNLYQDFKSKLQLKIMTFDSCQGEERKIIFYSMVATRESDTLNYIFPVALDDPQEQVEHKLKIQRLNVGFSRAQEMIWFVLSKPLSEYKGSIGQAMNHYYKILTEQKAGHADTDQSSPMEQKVLDWIYASEFYQLYEEQLELLPQFPIGDYLRQLDPTYRHPAYKVDFLLTYTHEQGIVHIVIEYDGFEYHFKQDAEIDEGNHGRYLTDSDIERQLTLESYGYKFIRINRFNLGKDPVKTLSDRLFKLVDSHFQDNTNEVVKSLQTQASSLLNKTAKQCPICKEIKDHQDYFDSSLKGGAGGYGRNCMSCKAIARPEASINRPKFRRRKW